MRIPSTLLLLLSIPHLLLLPCTIHSEVLCIEKEKHALLDFKQSFVEDLGNVLSTWRIDNEDCCNWEGIICANRTGHVISIDIGGGLLSYRLRPSLLELQHLTILHLSDNLFTMRIPEFIGSLSKLKSLDLSNSGFFGKIPPHLGNLTRLQYLWLEDSNGMYVDNLQWLSHLFSLQILDLSHVNLSNATDWLSTLKRLPSLSSFSCPSCSLPSPPLSSISPANSSTTLGQLDLSNNTMSSSTFSCLINSTKNLELLYLNNMNLDQNLHAFLEALIGRARYTLEALSLSANNLKELPVGLLKFSSLQRLGLSLNQLEKLTQDFKFMYNLQELDISQNHIIILPDLTTLSSLTSLDASSNRINRNIQEVLQHLPKNLESLDLSLNSLNGVISDTHFSKFSKLRSLQLSSNNLLIFNFTESWVPPFQLRTLELVSCKVGPAFPNWLLTQKSLTDLYMSNSSISGAVPDAFWNLSAGLRNLDLSYNKIHCVVPNLSLLPFYDSPLINLSSNAFYGPIPLFLFTATSLDLSNNRFSCFVPFHHRVLSSDMLIINLSNNLLSGSLPDWFFQFHSLLLLNLEFNMLSGTLPSAIGSLQQLNALHLNNNKFSGELPFAMKNCTSLMILELGNNKFSGIVPFWFGESMARLAVLSLRSNNFSGHLPFSMCHLRNIQVLDLSDNRISGAIPSCVYNFTSMATDKGLRLSRSASFSYETNGYIGSVDYVSVTWKGVLAHEYSGILQELNAIDLSSNHLTGQIPIGLTALKELKSLNLSRNYLNGSIPDKIGELKSLEVLTLSSNRLSGEIPTSLAGLTFLDKLNLSDNDLRGKIPTSTQLQSFDASSYAGNLKLCGKPLPNKCPGDVVGEPPALGGDHHEEDGKPFDMQAFYAALGTGFAFGFPGILGVLNFNTKCRLAFFGMTSYIGDWIFVRTALCQSRMQRSLCF